jgi:protein TonB
MPDLRRWIISGVIVILAHGAVVAAMMRLGEPSDPNEPTGVVALEFAPLAVAPANPDTDVAPGPEQTMSEASPEQPSEIVKETVDEKRQQTAELAEELPPEIKSAPDPIPLAQVLRKLEAPSPAQPRLEAPVTSAPEPAPIETAAIPAAPVQDLAIGKASNAVPSWTAKWVALLERKKRYPSEARSRREHGVAEVSFSLDRRGHLIDSQLVRSSGVPVLDREALALLQRAQPFPPPPDELAGIHVDLRVHIRFDLR